MGCCQSGPAENQVPTVRRMGAPYDENASELTPQSSVYSRDTNNGGSNAGSGWVARTFSNARGQKDEVLPSKEIKVGGLGYSQFILDKGGILIGDVYHIERKKLGQGTFGYVSKAKHKVTKEHRAVKTIPKENRGQVSPRGNQAKTKRIERIKLEIAIMKILDHPNICKLYEYFEDHKNFYLVMELCTGGELLSRIIGAQKLSEAEAAALMRQIFRAVVYMHSNLVCHRDIKPENLLFFNRNEPIGSSLLKIVDFGQSCMFKPGSTMTSKAGTPYYVAPQVLQGRYDESSDFWSCGVIMYLMLCGYPPFYGDSDSEVLQKVKTGKYEFKQVDWRRISSHAKTLVTGLLQMDPKKRCTAKQALEDAWFDRHAPQADDPNLDSHFLANLRSFCSKNKLEKAALHIIATQLKEAEIKGLREVFTSMDKDSDGLLSIDEFKEGLSNAGFASVIDDLQEVFEEIDMDGSGFIDYTEWLSASLSQRVYQQEEVLWAAFNHFDRDGDGRISEGELHNVLENGDVQDAFSIESVHQVMQAVHGEAFGYIDFQEFLSFMRRQGSAGGTNTKDGRTAVSGSKDTVVSI